MHSPHNSEPEECPNRQSGLLGLKRGGWVTFGDFGPHNVNSSKFKHQAALAPYSF